MGFSLKSALYVNYALKGVVSHKRKALIIKV